MTEGRARTAKEIDRALRIADAFDAAECPDLGFDGEHYGWYALAEILDKAAEEPPPPETE